jgi:hypothetical protein
MIDISKLSPLDVERFIHMQGQIYRQEVEAAKVRDARSYYDGDHPIPLTKRQQEYLGPLLTESGISFNHNLIKVVINKLRERLNIQGFTVNGASAASGEDAGPDEQLAQTLWQWWTANHMERQQIRLHRRAMRDGKSYVMVDYDEANQRPRFTLHEVDAGPSAPGIILHRDPSDPSRVLFATRYFSDFDPMNPGRTGVERKTVYLPNEVRKYIRDLRSPNTWAPYQDDGDPSWPLPWTDAQGRPFGVAVIEFANPDGSEAIAIAGLQNALNKAWLDLLAAGDTNGFPILTANYRDAMVEIEDESDANLEGTDEFKIAPGRLLEIFGGEIRRIEGANLDPMINLLWTIVSAIGGVTSMPQYFLRPIMGVDFPSGEALKQMEAGLVMRAKERMLEFGESWEEVMALAIRINATFGNRGPLPTPLTLATQWADPNTRMEELEAQSAQIHDTLGVPKPAVWNKLGYSPEEIAAFRDEEAAAKAAGVAAIAGALQASQARNAAQTNPRTGAA